MDKIYDHMYLRSVFDFCRTAELVFKNSFMKAFFEGFSQGADHIFGKIEQRILKINLAIYFKAV